MTGVTDEADCYHNNPVPTCNAEAVGRGEIIITEEIRQNEQSLPARSGDKELLKREQQERERWSARWNKHHIYFLQVCLEITACYCDYENNNN